MSPTPALKDEATLASNLKAVGDSTVSTVLSTRPFTYSSGHGDFCFLRLVDRYPKPPAGAVDTEFVRKGTFPFMRLPKEIRFQIYEIVLTPLLSKHAFLPKGQRHLVLKIQHFEDKYYEHMLAEIKWILKFGTNISPEKVRKYREEEKEIAALCKRFLHPSSARAYEITFPRFSTPGVGSMWEKIPPTLLAGIRNLSNVSCQIRQELGTCAWTRSFLTVEEGAYREALLCLKERPAIYPGLKMLYISIPWMRTDDECSDECSQTGHSSENHICRVAITALIEFIDRRLQLDLLIIKLDILMHRVGELLDSTEKPQWMDALRGLSCARSFSLMTSYRYGSSSSQQEATLPTGNIDAELESLMRPLVSLRDPGKILRDFAESVDWERHEEEYEDPGFHYRIQADGEWRDTKSTYTEDHNFEIEAHPSYQP